MQPCLHCDFQNANGRTHCKRCHQPIYATAEGGPTSLPAMVESPSLPATLPSPVRPLPITATNTPKQWIKFGLGIGAVTLGCCILLALVGSVNRPAKTVSAPTAVRTRASMTNPTRAQAAGAAIAPTRNSTEVSATDTAQLASQQLTPTHVTILDSTLPATQRVPTQVLATMTELPVTETPAPTEVPATMTLVPATQIPTPTPLPATATSMPEPTETPGSDDWRTSGGLGLSRATWERQHGAPERTVAGFSDYEGGSYSVSYQAGNAWQLEAYWPNDGIRMSDAQAIGRSLVPHDAELLETYTARSGSMVELYHSRTLIKRFPETMKLGDREVSMWTEASPGDFIIIYGLSKNRVLYIITGIGNNPLYLHSALTCYQCAVSLGPVATPGYPGLRAVACVLAQAG